MKRDYINLYFTEMNMLDESYLLQEMERIQEFSFSGVTSLVEKITKTTNQILRENGVNIDKVKSIGKNLSSNFKKLYKEGKSPEEASSLLIKSVF